MISALSVLINIVSGIALYTFRFRIAILFTYDEKVQEIVTDTVPVAAAILFGLFGPSSGMIFGCGLQKMAAPVGFFWQYIVALPSAALLGLKFGFGIKGFWIAELVGIYGMAVSYLAIVLFVDW